MFINPTSGWRTLWYFILLSTNGKGPIEMAFSKMEHILITGIYWTILKELKLGVPLLIAEDYAIL